MYLPCSFSTLSSFCVVYLADYIAEVVDVCDFERLTNIAGHGKVDRFSYFFVSS